MFQQRNRPGFVRELSESRGRGSFKSDTPQGAWSAESRPERGRGSFKRRLADSAKAPRRAGRDGVDFGAPAPSKAPRFLEVGASALMGMRGVGGPALHQPPRVGLSAGGEAAAPPPAPAVEKYRAAEVPAPCPAPGRLRPQPALRASPPLVSSRSQCLLPPRSGGGVRGAGWGWEPRAARPLPSPAATPARPNAHRE